MVTVDVAVLVVKLDSMLLFIDSELLELYRAFKFVKPTGCETEGMAFKRIYGKRIYLKLGPSRWQNHFAI